MKNILTEALVDSATNASFIFSYTNSAKLRAYFIVIYNLYNIDFTTVLSDVKSGCIIQNGKIF